MEFRSQGDPLGYNDIEVVYVQDIFKMLLAKVNQEVVFHLKNKILKKKRRRKIKRENKQTNKNNVAKIIKKIQVQN